MALRTVFAFISHNNTGLLVSYLNVKGFYLLLYYISSAFKPSLALAVW